MLVFKIARKQHRFFAAAMAASLFVITVAEHKTATVKEIKIVYVRPNRVEEEDV